MFVEKKIGKLSLLNTQLNCRMNNNAKMLTERRINKSSLLYNKSFSVKHHWGNWLWAFIVIRGWGQKKAWDCGLGLARFDCSTWTKRKSTQAYLATLLPCARHKGKREVCGFKTISNHTSKNETRLLIIHESILIHTNDEKQLNKWNEGEETNLCPRIPNIF